MIKIERLALTTDFSAGSRQSYAPTAELARVLSAQVHLLHCVEHPFQYSPGWVLPEDGYERYRKTLRQELERVANSSVFEGLEPQQHLLKGYGPDAVREFAEQERMDLIVQASHGYTGWKHFVLGSFAERVLRTSKVPVLTLRSSKSDTTHAGDAEAGFHPKKVLYPYDFSAPSQQATDQIRLLARSYSAKVLVLHVWNDTFTALPATEMGGGAVVWESLSQTKVPEKLAEDLKEFAIRELDGIDYEVEVMTGDPTTVILERAGSSEADVICMATHGWTGLRHILLGSVAEKVVRGAQCPTLTVRSSPETLRD